MFGMGFTEIMLIAVIAILFLGPDKLPSAMVDIAKFFRNVKNTVGSVQSSIEQEMQISEIKQEALAYKKELLEASNKVKNATHLTSTTIDSEIMDILNTHDSKEPTPPKPKPQLDEEKEQKQESKDV